uniref:Uncharacterized protein n=1 Tax=Dulem virus 42 TaxID=3145760 RepID=A0AAU8BA98_9CAUD
MTVSSTTTCTLQFPNGRSDGSLIHTLFVFSSFRESFPNVTS